MPLLAQLLLLAAEAAAAPDYRRPVDLRILVLATNGQEAGLTAIRSALDHQGTPYDVAYLGLDEPLPALEADGRGRYQGVILTIGNLGICDPSCRSALSESGWLRLDTYARDYGVRTLAYYGYPEARYGLRSMGSMSPTPEAPLTADLTAEGARLFADLRPNLKLKIVHAFAYLGAIAEPGEGETTEALIRSGEHVLTALHRKADGREYLFQTFDNSATLLHSLTLQRGLLQWLTRGVFVGHHRAFLNAQVDDLFLSNYLFDPARPQCNSGAEAASAEAISGSRCATLRLDRGDLESVARWQRRWRAKPQFSSMRLSMAFNGFGASDGDDLTAAARDMAGEFLWVSHTFTHKILDCYGPGCEPATAEQGAYEVHENNRAARQLGLPTDATSMVTPGISGLNNAEFLRGAAEAGIRYLVSDTSRAEGRPDDPNTGIRSRHDSRILLIPRRPTAVFYNANHGWSDGLPGSEPDEYNALFGPNGQFRVGGTADGPPFYSTEQSYDQIVDRESDVLAGYLLRGEMYPWMFHQANLYRFDGDRTLMTDVLEMTLRKYESITSTPVVSMSQTDLGRTLEGRMAVRGAGVEAAYFPGEGIRLTAKAAVSVPLTGVCAENCQAFGGQSLSSVPVTPEAPVTVPTH